MADAGVAQGGNQDNRSGSDAERFHRTLAGGWAFKKFYNTEDIRLAALSGRLHQNNRHWTHSAIGSAAPITRWDILAGHHT